MLKSIYFLFGLLLLAGVAAAEWRGWTPKSPTEVKDIPRTVRDNPGSYRPTYIFAGGRYPRGK